MNIPREISHIAKSPVKISHLLYCYRSGGAHKVQLKVVFLILKYYLGLALCIDSYVVVFFLPLLLRQFLSCTSLTTLSCVCYFLGIILGLAGSTDSYASIIVGVSLFNNFQVVLLPTS